MDQHAFESELAASGYDEVDVKGLDHKPANTEHAHDYDIRGLVLDGIFAVWQNERVTHYRAGDIFDVSAGVKHSEEIGPDGARVVIGRRAAQSL